jgi:HEAT repeat protein
VRAVAIGISLLSCGFALVPAGIAQTDPFMQEIVDLKDPSVAVRLQAAKKLGEAKDARAVDPLISVFKDADQSVRRNAQSALIAIGVPAIKSIDAALLSPDVAVRASAVTVLSRIEDPGAFESLELIRE